MPLVVLTGNRARAPAMHLASPAQRRYARGMVGKTFPWAAAGFAGAACVALAVITGSMLPAAAIFLVWCATLWLAASQPPAPAPPTVPPPLDATQMRDLFELFQVPVVVTRKSRVIIANAAARGLFGGHILDQDIRMVLRNPDALQLIDGGQSGGVTVPGLLRRKDVWRINHKALPDGMGVLEFIDNSAEADVSRAHTDFVANASHELRTPLAAIIGYVETLREEGAEIEPALADRFLSTIQREALRLQSLVSDLMSLSRIEAEKHDIPAEDVDLSVLVRKAARDAAGHDRQERLGFDVAPGIMVRGDSQQLEQLMRNLVDNALKYGGEDRPVTISLSPDDRGRVAVRVADSGDGIPPEHLPHLTRRFYRTDPGRSRASGGTGLGLAIVKHIVERHRGRLDIESVLGTGTTVTVRLNRAEPPAAKDDDAHRDRADPNFDSMLSPN